MKHAPLRAAALGVLKRSDQAGSRPLPPPFLPPLCPSSRSAESAGAALCWDSGLSPSPSQAPGWPVALLAGLLGCPRGDRDPDTCWRAGSPETSPSTNLLWPFGRAASPPSAGLSLPSAACSLGPWALGALGRGWPALGRAFTVSSVSPRGAGGLPALSAVRVGPAWRIVSSII